MIFYIFLSKSGLYFSWHALIGAYAAFVIAQASTFKSRFPGRHNAKVEVKSSNTEPVCARNLINHCKHAVKRGFLFSHVAGFGYIRLS